MKKIKELINNPQYSLAYLQKHSRYLDNLTQTMQIFLPTEYHSYCYVVRFNQDNILVISTSQQNLLTPLRFLKPRLLQQLRRHNLFQGLSDIEFIYAPEPASLSHKKNIPLDRPTRSEEAANNCLSTADNCSSEKLRNNLRKLAQQLKQSSTHEK